MRLQIPATLAVGLLLGALPTFAQAPASPTNGHRLADKAEHKAQWKECMGRLEANNKGSEKSETEHKGNGKMAGTSKSTEGKMPEKTGQNGEGKKMNRHEEMMQECRNQLYGGRHEEPGAEIKDNGAAHN